MKAFWYLGVAMQIVGLTVVPVALFVGIYGDNLGAEWAIAAAGVVVFFAGTGVRRWAGE